MVLVLTHILLICKLSSLHIHTDLALLKCLILKHFHTLSCHTMPMRLIRITRLSCAHPKWKLSILFVGYANEFGEAFRTHIPRLMYLGSYGIASTYCLADSIDKGRRCYQQNNHLNNYLQKRKAVETSVEAAIWQGLASVIIPGFTINRICAASRFTLRRVARTMPPRAQTWVTTFVGLSAIPLIIKPIDG